MTIIGSLLGSQDLHVHTTMSDGDMLVGDVVALAERLGLRIGISDHVSSRNRARFVSTSDKLRDYLVAIEAEPVLRSAELCWQNPFSMEVAGELADRLDYLIGSNHGFILPGGEEISPWSQKLPAGWEDRPDAVMDQIVNNLCDLVRTMPIAIVAHSTLLPPALLNLDVAQAWWTEEREERFVKAVVASGVALEISSRYRLPHDRLLSRAFAAGATFSLGSDGHHEHQVGRLDWAVETAIRIGVNDNCLFVPERAVRG